LGTYAVNVKASETDHLKGGRLYAWSSAPVISTIVLGAVLLVALGFYEVYAPLPYPMLPVKFFKNIRGFTVLLVVCFVGGE
jgi:hypothetical protein